MIMHFTDSHFPSICERLSTKVVVISVFLLHELLMKLYCGIGVTMKLSISIEVISSMIFYISQVA